VAAAAAALARQVGEIPLTASMPDLLVKPRLPTPYDLVAGLDRIMDMVAETLKICECTQSASRSALGQPRMPFGIHSAANIYANRIPELFQIHSGQSYPDPEFPNCGVFQLANIALFPNEYGEEYDDLLTPPGREIFVVFADDPPRDGEMDSAEARRIGSNAKRARRHQEEASAEQARQRTD